MTNPTHFAATATDATATAGASATAQMTAGTAAQITAGAPAQMTAGATGAGHAGMALDYDIAICGAGPAGMTLAALLVKRGVAAQRIALIDAKTLAQASTDPRSLALSWGSRQILEEISAWPTAATAIEQIHVSRRGQFGRSLIDRKDYDLPALGYVTRYGDIVTALGAECDRAGIVSLRPARVLTLDEESDAITLILDANGAPQTLRAAIVVQAEGGLFNEQLVRAVNRDYQQTAIIAQVRSRTPPPHRAYERFTEQGPLALLPQNDEYSLVWCVRPENASALLSLNDAEFLSALGQAFGDRVGSFTHATPRLGFPLGLNAAAHSTARTVTIGNAAQTLHPVAGQGLNLGLRDVTVLARLLAQGATPEKLSQYTELRQRDRSTTVRLTDTMARVFANDTPMQGLLGLSLAAIDMVGPARSLLAELMMYGRR